MTARLRSAAFGVILSFWVYAAPAARNMSARLTRMSRFQLNQPRPEARDSTALSGGAAALVTPVSLTTASDSGAGGAAPAAAAAGCAISPRRAPNLLSICAGV